MATKKKPSTDQSYTSPVDYLGTLGDLEKTCHLQSITLSAEDRISSGNICLDLLLGGGFSPSMTTFSGGEQTCKTTTAITAMAASVTQKVGMRVLWDAEGSSGSSTDYVSNIFETMGVNVDIETLFGVREKGKYTTPPLVYYRDEGSMEDFFGWTAGLLRRLPDKRKENGKWWYIYEGTRENKAQYKDQMDLQMSRANDAVYIEAEDGALQAFIIIDSWPSLLPASMDTDDPKAGMALVAREFSKHVPRVKGKLRAKRVIILGINQLRQKPGVLYGDPRYEPGGEALKFYSDVRCWYTARSLSGVPFNPKGKGQIEEEEGVDGGTDIYRYVHVKAIKNKLAIPNRETWLRVWVSDAQQQAHGLDPVWDTFYALSLTGQVSGKRSSMLLNVHGLGEAQKNINWAQFKTLVLGTKEDQTAIYDKIGYKTINLRKGLFNLSKKGIMEKLYMEAKNTKTSGKAEEDEAEDDDE